MTATKENLGSNRVRLEIDVPAAQFQDSIEKVYRASRNEFVIPGFRRGKAPRAVIESHYGPGTFYNKAFDELFPEVYAAAVDEVGVIPVGPPENLTFMEVDGNKGIRFSVEFFVMPDVRLGTYEGLKGTRHHHTVTESEIDAEVDKLRDQNARWVQSDGPAEMGNQIKIDFAGRVNGELFEGGTAEDYALELGSGRFIEGFEDQLVGMRPGEDRDVTVTFPESYHAQDLAGQEAVFAVHLNGILRKELPDVDDDFVEDVSEFDTVADWRSSIREELQQETDEKLEHELENALFAQVVETSEVDVPKVMVDTEVEDRIMGMRQQLMFQGISLEDYLAAMGTDLDTFTDSMRADAENSIKVRLILPELIEALGAAPTEEDLQQEYARMAAQRELETEEFLSRLSDTQKEAIASREGVRRAMDKLKEISEITDVDLDETGEVQGSGSELPEGSDNIHSEE